MVERIERDLRGVLPNVTVATHLEPVEDPVSWQDATGIAWTCPRDAGRPALGLGCPRGFEGSQTEGARWSRMARG